MITIAIDLMGGDKGPDEIAQGAFDARKAFGIQVALVGPQEVLDIQSSKEPALRNQFTPAPASQIVGVTG